MGFVKFLIHDNLWSLIYLVLKVWCLQHLVFGYKNINLFLGHWWPQVFTAEAMAKNTTISRQCPCWFDWVATGLGFSFQTSMPPTKSTKCIGEWRHGWRSAVVGIQDAWCSILCRAFYFVGFNGSIDFSHRKRIAWRLFDHLAEPWDPAVKRLSREWSRWHTLWLCWKDQWVILANWLNRKVQI